MVQNLPKTGKRGSNSKPNCVEPFIVIRTYFILNCSFDLFITVWGWRPCFRRCLFSYVSGNAHRTSAHSITDKGLDCDRNKNSRPKPFRSYSFEDEYFWNGIFHVAFTVYNVHEMLLVVQSCPFAFADLIKSVHSYFPML